jgi:hypothetical protein
MAAPEHVCRIHRVRKVPAQLLLKRRRMLERAPKGSHSPDVPVKLLVERLGVGECEVEGGS